MRVLVLGGSGFVGRATVDALLNTHGITPVIASRQPIAKQGVETIALNALDAEALSQVCKNVDAVVNCITGDGHTIEASARSLVAAIGQSGANLPVVHMSTMSVYGAQEGTVDEQGPLLDNIGWYGTAKIHAEAEFRSLAQKGARVNILRPGCVYGPRSDLWTLRIGRLLKSGSLGDLAVAGDGWSNLVHVRDVASACINCLTNLQAEGEVRTFNLSAPDSPRWNTYFHDFALAIEATPLRYLTKGELWLRSRLMAPPLKVAERICRKLRVDSSFLPDGMPPSLLGLWNQQIRLDGRALQKTFNFEWTTYESGLAESVADFKDKYSV